MSTYGGKDFAATFRTVRKNTIQIAEDIPEDKYNFKPAADCRSVAQTLVHIAVTAEFPIFVQSSKTNDFAKVDVMPLFQKMMGEEAKPRSKAEIVALLKSEGEKFATFVGGLSNSFLAESVKLPPGAEPASKTRFEMLLGVKEHEMHHRAQLMTMERMIGVVPHLTRQRQAQMERMQAAMQPAR